ncbi:hypothetical protein JR316_0009946 [Psilocybe cubensis]|uniref:Uncharacterized protein n=1 Tax=Psilocybe cubensis TaxID=181762 RepID=A0ACB8GQH2_PSICU|nr:hypothetical protein JR316_0009946 [Psilocybe cubensis]KAH9477720.1 hypothetical protein JR316_0009946 [Psilocybe cubensis]
MLLLETAQTGMVSHDVFVTFAASLSDAAGVDDMRMYWFSIPISGGGIAQLFFAYRMWRVSGKKSKGGPLIISTLALASIVSALISARAFFQARRFSILLDNDDNSGSFASIGVWNGVGAICDITIALCMPYYVRAKIKRRLTVFTDAIAIFAILHLCLYFATSPAFIVPGLTVSKVYANTMLVILNNRMQIVNGRFVTGSDVEDDGTATIGSQNRIFASEQSRSQSPTETETRSTERMSRRTRARSTIIVARDRLVIRLGDVDVDRKSQRTVAPGDKQKHGRVEDRRKRSAEGDVLSVDTEGTPSSVQDSQPNKYAHAARGQMRDARGVNEVNGFVRFNA